MKLSHLGGILNVIMVCLVLCNVFSYNMVKFFYTLHAITIIISINFKDDEIKKDNT